MALCVSMHISNVQMCSETHTLCVSMHTLSKLSSLFTLGRFPPLVASGTFRAPQDLSHYSDSISRATACTSTMFSPVFFARLIAFAG